jgi:hypothetical protein
VNVAQTSDATKPLKYYRHFPFDGTHFSFRKTSIEYHLCGCSKELWGVVVRGFKVNDLNDLTPREYYERQLNATAREKI